MTTVYAEEFLFENEVIDKSYLDTRNPYAKLERDSYARELRKKGFAVKTSVAHFDNATGYYLHAVRRRTGTVENAYAPGQGNEKEVAANAN